MEVAADEVVTTDDEYDDADVIRPMPPRRPCDEEELEERHQKRGEWQTVYDPDDPLVLLGEPKKKCFKEKCSLYTLW